MDLPIPIYILTPGSKVPDEVCYLITKDGVFLNKKAGLITAMVKVEGICFLESVVPKATIHLPKIPVSVMAQVLSFFCRIHDDLDSEVNLMLYYRDDEKRFELSCPLQVVTSASVGYKANEGVAGCQLVGTIHSHNTMSAFHSGVDQSDEEYFDGLHITIGKVDKFPEFLISCSVMANGQRFKLEPEEVIEGIVRIERELPNMPRRAIGEIASAFEAIGEAIINPLGGNDWPKYRPPLEAGFYWGRYNEQFYRLDFDQTSSVFPNEWLEKVKRKTFFGGSGLTQRPLGSVSEDDYWGKGTI